MAEVRQKMRGTTAELDAVSSYVGHLVYDTQTHNLRVYDGVTLGGRHILTRAQLALDPLATIYNATRLNSQLGSFYQNASNLNAGTIADARLPGTMTPKIFSGGLTQAVAAGSVVALYQTIGGFDRARLVAEGPGDLIAWQKYSTTGAFQVQLHIAGPGGLTDLKYGNYTVWTAGNSGAGSGSDSDLLDGQHGPFYLNASNLNAGTLADARLPTTMSAKTFSGTVTLNNGLIVSSGSVSLRTYTHAAGGDYIELKPSDMGAGKPGLYFVKFPGSAVWALRLWDTVGASGEIRIDCPTFTRQGYTVWDSGNDGSGSGLDADLFEGQHGSFYLNASNLNAGTLATARLPVAMGTGKTFDAAIYINSNTPEKVIFFQHNGISRATEFYLTASEAMNWDLFNSSGAYVRNMNFRQSDGRLHVDGFIHSGGQVIIGYAGTAVYPDGNIGFSGGMAGFGGSLWEALSARIKNDGGTYGINISGSAASLGGVAASGYMRSPSTSNNNVETNFPIGHQVMAIGFHTRGGLANVFNDGGNVNQYTISDGTGGAQLAGTWVMRGSQTTIAGGLSMVQRVA